MTRTAARAVCGWKWLLNVSGHSSTVSRPTFRAGRARNQSTNVCRANRGSCRAGCMPPPQLALVEVGQELGFVRRHVDAHRTLALAAFAGEAEVERVLHRIGAPAGDDLAFQHLPQQPRATPRGVLLLGGDLEARTHQLAVLDAALAHADAAQRGDAEAARVIRQGEVRPRPSRLVAGPETQVVGRVVRIDD